MSLSLISQLTPFPVNFPWVGFLGWGKVLEMWIITPIIRHLLTEAKTGAKSHDAISGCSRHLFLHLFLPTFCPWLFSTVTSFIVLCQYIFFLLHLPVSPPFPLPCSRVFFPFFWACISMSSVIQCLNEYRFCLNTFGSMCMNEFFGVSCKFT